MGNLFQGPHLIIVLVIILLLFGATRLPALARSLGQSTKIFRNEIKSDKDTAQVVETDESGAPVAKSTPTTSTASPTTTHTDKP